MYDTVNSGLPDNDVYSISIDISGNKWIGTGGGGISVYNVNGVVSKIDLKNSVSKASYKIVLHQSYPITRILYSITKHGHVVLKVFDIKGRLLKNLVNSVKRAGNHHVNFDCRNIPNGAFLINLRAENNSVTKKIIVLK